MAINVFDFVSAYPEFKDAPQSLVQAKLNDAITLTPDIPWKQGQLDPPPGGNTIQQQGAFLHCARLLALSPYARHMKLVEKDGSTLYDTQLKKLVRMVSSGFRVL